jgi:hypothetical protein
MITEYLILVPVTGSGASAYQFSVTQSDRVPATGSEAIRLAFSREYHLIDQPWFVHILQPRFIWGSIYIKEWSYANLKQN